MSENFDNFDLHVEIGAQMNELPNIVDIIKEVSKQPLMNIIENTSQRPTIACRHCQSQAHTSSDCDLLLCMYCNVFHKPFDCSNSSKTQTIWKRNQKIGSKTSSFNSYTKHKSKQYANTNSGSNFDSFSGSNFKSFNSFKPK